RVTGAKLKMALIIGRRGATARLVRRQPPWPSSPEHVGKKPHATHLGKSLDCVTFCGIGTSSGNPCSGRSPSVGVVGQSKLHQAGVTQALAPVGDVGAGHVLGRYELLLPIASGGMAMVWAARLKGTRGFQKIVAVKTMLPKLTEDEQFEQMFLDEASLASQIRHPHVVEILDLGEQDGVLFLVMEWIDGVPLNQLMKAAKKVGGIPLSA